MTTMTPFLMFEGRAEEAMTRYVAVLPDSEVLRLDRFGAEGPGAEGSVRHGEARIAGQVVRFFDSPAPHAFTFTPSWSFFVSVDTAEELDRVVADLATGGTFLMPTGDYGFSRRFAWLNDEFGVSWQVNLD